jgi:hypothetical protein
MLSALTDEEIKALLGYARRKFLEEASPMSPSLRTVRAALGKIEPKPEPEPLTPSPASAMSTVAVQLGARRNG